MAKNKTREKEYFFVDEAGDPTFYNRYGRCIVGEEGCTKVLVLGLIRTENPIELRRKVLELKDEIAGDPYLKDVPSIQKTKKSFHAKDDCPEVREKLYKLIKGLDFKAEFVVGRKVEKLFVQKHKKRESLFYNDMVSKLFENKLHLAKENHIYFAVRGNKTRQIPFENAIQTAKIIFEGKWKIKNESGTFIYPQSPLGEPCLQIIDYMNWAIQRAYLKGEDRYLKFVDGKISYLLDVYDFENYPNNFYSRRNKFDITKISPL